MMPLNLQLLAVGAATVIDTALLLSLLERRNLRKVATPVVTLLVATWLFHSGEFVRLLLASTTGDWAELVRTCAMGAMSAGLLLMPASLIHGVLRLWHTGLDFQVRPHAAYAVAYAPVALLPVVIYALVARVGQPFLGRVAPFVAPVVVLMCGVNLGAVVTFLRARAAATGAARRFLAGMAAILAVVTALLAYSFWGTDRTLLETGSPRLLMLVLAPLGPTLFFAYFVIRYRFMQLLLERTFVYGAILAAAVLLHQLIVVPATHAWGDRLRIDLGLIEGIAVLLLVLLYQPTRMRVTEALRYLLGRDVRGQRERTRQLAVEMWSREDGDAQSMVDWFVGSVRDIFEVRRITAWLLEPSGPVLVSSGDKEGVTEAQARALHGALKSHAFTCLDGSGLQDPQLSGLLSRLGAFLAVRLDHAGFSGLLVMGPRRFAGEYGEEEKSQVLMLVELFGACLHNRFLQMRRLEAERLAARNEHLSAVGMLTSCLAHEIKNPLSSIKTIATVMREQLGEEHALGEDLKLILGEIDRLSSTTSQFLGFARPADHQTSTAAVGPVLRGAVQVLAGMAHGKHIQLETECEPDLPDVAADENALREIVFNLLLNAIEAVQPGGRVRVSVRRNGKFVVTTVRDDGPGVAPESVDRLFSPFFTSKPAGTGLGLFIVRRHIERLGGEVTCHSLPREETCFTVKLPFANSTSHGAT
jgi:signal transduction histidine kinase